LLWLQPRAERFTISTSRKPFESGRIACVWIFSVWRRRLVVAYRRITSRGRKRGRCPPRSGLGRCRLGQAEKEARLEPVANQVGPINGGQKQRIGSKPLHDAAAA